MPNINRYWNSDPDSLVEREPPQTYDLCKSCECINQLLWKEKRLKRELWLARAERAVAKQAYYDVLSRGISSERSEMYYLWNNVERKCRVKAEEYK